MNLKFSFDAIVYKQLHFRLSLYFWLELETSIFLLKIYLSTIDQSFLPYLESLKRITGAFQKYLE